MPVDARISRFARKSATNKRFICFGAMGSSSGARNILVVEDEPLLRQLSVDELEDAGYRVLEAASADQALAMMTSGEAVWLVFTDVNMPGGMDGLELARCVHCLWPDVKLIVTSGAGRVHPSYVPRAGRFIPKPYSLAQLRRTIGELGEARPGRPS